MNKKGIYTYLFKYFEADVKYTNRAKTHTLLYFKIIDTMMIKNDKHDRKHGY